MNVTFLVGNGFDISCGISTSYRSFYEWYLKQPSDTDNIKRMKDDIDKDYENWADFEIGLGKFTQKFSIDKIEDYFECYYDASKSIIRYLELQTSDIEFSKCDEAIFVHFKNSIINFYKNLTPQLSAKIRELDDDNNITISFISFNYTDILNKALEKTSDITILPEPDIPTELNPKIINVHGSLNRWPILGVSYLYQIPNKEFAKNSTFQKLMIKAESINAIGESWYDDASKLITCSKVICVFGMSIGDSDGVWWEKIANHLIDDKESRLIIFWYTRNPPKANSVFESITMSDKIKEKIIDYTSLRREDVDEVKERINIVFNSEKMFNLQLS